MPGLVPVLCMLRMLGLLACLTPVGPDPAGLSPWAGHPWSEPAPFAWLTRGSNVSPITPWEVITSRLQRGNHKGYL